MDALNDVAVLVPVARGEMAWINLLADLKQAPKNTELVICSPQEPTHLAQKQISAFSQSHKIKWIKSLSGRAQQLNTAAHSTHKAYLWFLHADSRFSSDSLFPLLEISPR